MRISEIISDVMVLNGKKYGKTIVTATSGGRKMEISLILVLMLRRMVLRFSQAAHIPMQSWSDNNIYIMSNNKKT